MNDVEGARERLVEMVAKLSDERAAEMVATLRRRPGHEDADRLERIRREARRSSSDPAED